MINHQHSPVEWNGTSSGAMEGQGSFDSLILTFTNMICQGGPPSIICSTCLQSKTRSQRRALYCPGPCRGMLKTSLVKNRQRSTDDSSLGLQEVFPHFHIRVATNLNHILQCQPAFHHDGCSWRPLTGTPYVSLSNHREAIYISNPNDKLPSSLFPEYCRLKLWNCI